MRQIQKIFKWLTLMFFGITIYAMTIGQMVPVEFVDWHHRHLFYDFILWGLPIVVLLTLIWTLKTLNTRKTNILIGIFTSIVAGAMGIASIYLMFIFGFGAWINEEMMYENKDNPGVKINRQLWDNGALGYGRKRTVKLTPFFIFWNLVEQVDTEDIDKENWILVKKEGNIKFP